MGWKDRTFALRPIEDKAELLAHFGVANWPLCTAFAFEELIFANCSRTRAGVPAFAVIRNREQIGYLPPGPDVSSDGEQHAGMPAGRGEP